MEREDQKPSSEFSLDQPAGQSPSERLSTVIGPILQNFSESFARAIPPVLQESQHRIGQVLRAQVEQVLPAIRSEPPQQSPREAEGAASSARIRGREQLHRNQVLERTKEKGGIDQPASASRQVNAYDQAGVTRPQSTNLADLLERVLDKGIVIAGDITVSVVGIELLELKIRLLIASVDKAQEIGINWWQSDPALSSRARALPKERDELTERVARLEARLDGRSLDGKSEDQALPASSTARDKPQGEEEGADRSHDRA